MRIEVLNQFAGVNPIGVKMKKLLGRGTASFHHVKFLMAYANDSGIGYLKPELEKFHDAGGILEFIVGIEGGITTHQVLTFITSRLKNSDLYIFHDSGGKCSIHNKVVIFEGEKEIVALIGSANLTLGGLFSNCESDILLEIKREEENEDLIQAIENTWSTYRNTQKPLSPGNLISPSPALLTELKTKLRAQHRIAKKMNAVKLSGVPSVQFAIPVVPKLGTTGVTAAQQAGQAHGSKLYVEVLKETGAGGTQIQIPTDALAFFGKDKTKPMHLRIRVNGSPVRDAYIYHFANFTHRLSVREFGGISRPAILILTRHKREYNTYDCSVIAGGQYMRYAPKLKNRTRTGAKGWSIE